MANRYFEHESRISWDVEDNPPVELSKSSSARNTAGSPSFKRKEDGFDLNLKTPKKVRPDGTQPGEDQKLGLHGKAESATADRSKSTPGSGEAPKMRYRCKLCGQPKQNHTCPYQKSLQRSIGVTVHSAVNAFSAAEPGDLAPALSEMNNFVPGTDDMPEITPSRPKREPMEITHAFRSQPAARPVPHVTPETIRSMNQTSRMPKSPTAGYLVHGQPYNSAPYDPYAMNGRMMPPTPTPLSNVRRRRILSPNKNAPPPPSGQLSDPVFVESIPLRQESFRVVTTSSHSSFKYPSIPLPYLQRKTLSDNLFELSKELPTLKEECAIMLRQAREEDMWDIAVAELLAQVIVAIHCPPNDTRLEGLSRYLNSLGFSC
jgi:hypothetical protein